MVGFKWIFLFVVLSAHLRSEATLGKSDKKKNNKNIKVGPSIENVYERQLVSKSFKASDVIKEHNAYNEVEKELKKFDGVSLVYVTPWNTHGYDVAKLFSHKFTYVSPVWLSIHLKNNLKFDLRGKQDIDTDWMKEVTKAGNSAIVPRIIFSEWTMDDFQKLFSTEQRMQDCIEAIVDIILKKKFDGVVIELWTQLMGGFKKEAVDLMGHMKEALQEFNKKLIFVLPAPIHRGGKNMAISREDFRRLAPLVDAFSLVTYDYSQPSRPGANSPLGWVEKCIEVLEPDNSSPYRSKILIGLNFYGYQYSSRQKFSSVVGHQYIETLQTFKPKIMHDDKAAEHYLKYKHKGEDFLVYYPSLYSIDQRLKLAHRMGVGVSIWEIGQGLDYFYDLL